MKDERSIRPVTQSLVNHLYFDLPLTPPQITDFGVTSDDHYRALHTVLFDHRGEDRPETVQDIEAHTHARTLLLDDALGNGPKLNALVKLYAPEYADRVTFETSWDVMDGRTGEAAKRLQQAAEDDYRQNAPRAAR